jgi:hypothetical protein
MRGNRRRELAIDASFRREAACAKARTGGHVLAHADMPGDLHSLRNHPGALGVQPNDAAGRFRCEPHIPRERLPELAVQPPTRRVGFTQGVRSATVEPPRERRGANFTSPSHTDPPARGRTAERDHDAFQSLLHRVLARDDYSAVHAQYLTTTRRRQTMEVLAVAQNGHHTSIAAQAVPPSRHAPSRASSSSSSSTSFGTTSVGASPSPSIIVSQSSIGSILNVGPCCA